MTRGKWHAKAYPTNACGILAVWRVIDQKPTAAAGVRRRARLGAGRLPGAMRGTLDALPARPGLHVEASRDEAVPVIFRPAPVVHVLPRLDATTDRRIEGELAPDQRRGEVGD